MKIIPASEFKNRPAQAGEKVFDVREPAEFAAEYLPGSENLPLSILDREASKFPKAGPVYLICRSGVRSKKAAESLEKLGFENISVIEGGLEACKACAAGVQTGSVKVWSLERQVRFSAGLLVLLGVLLGAGVHPGFFVLSGFVGAGLVFAAVTDTCAMAMLLARMPWNQKKSV